MVVGNLIHLIDRLGLTKDTIVIFASDNGTTHEVGSGLRFFDSVGDLRGLKGSLTRVGSGSH